MTENDVNITVNFTGTETGIIPVLPDQSINYDHTAILRFCDGWVSSVCLSVCLCVPTFFHVSRLDNF